MGENARRLGSRILFYLIICGLVFSIIPVDNATAEGVREPRGTRQSFTHTVFVEELTATWCVHCPYVADALYNIYQSNEYEYYFVAMITDVNDDAGARANEYNIPGYPTTIFDGGFITEVGSTDDVEQDEQRFRPDIESSGEREDVWDLEVDTYAYDLGAPVIQIDVTVSNLVDAEYNGYIKTYITEIGSRYIMDDGNPYHFGFLDYAIDEEFTIPALNIWEDSITWDGSEHQDANGDYFSDIDPTNIMIITSIFSAEIDIGGYDPPYSGPQYKFEAHYVDEADGAIPILPDYGLEMTSPSLAESVNPGENAIYTLTITNRGNIQDTIALTKSGTNSDWSSFEQDSITLAPDESQEVTFTVSVPLDTLVGDYDITVTATSTGDPTEYKSLVTTTTVLPVYDVEMTSSNLQRTVFPGDSATYTLTVTNEGNIQDTFDMTKSGVRSDWGHFDQNSFSLDSGGSRDVIFTVDVPSDSEEGNYPITVTATSRGDTQQSASLVTTTTVDLEPNYDVTLYLAINAITTLPGNTIAYPITVTNSGNVQDIIHFTKSGTHSSDWAELSHTEVTLDAGGSQDLELTIDIPIDAEPDDYSISVKGTSNGDAGVYDEVTTITTVEPLVYDVNLEVDKTTESLKAGQATTFNITGTNLGNIEDSIEITISEGPIDWTDLDNSMLSLNPEESDVVTLTVTVPSGEEPTTHDFKVVGTSAGDSSVHDDITVTVTVIPTEEPITISEVTHSPEYPSADDEITIKAKVTGSLSSVEVIYPLKTGDTSTSKDMADTNDDIYEAIIGPYPEGEYEYKILVEDSQGEAHYSPPYPFTVENVSISYVNHAPENPTPEDEITISTQVTGPISKVQLSYCLIDGVCLSPEDMTDEGDDVYEIVIGPLEEGDYEYEIWVMDLNGDKHESQKYTFTVEVEDIIEPDPESIEITEVSHSPVNITTKDEITITAKVMGSSISSIQLSYCIKNDVCFPALNMTSLGNDMFQVKIGPLEEGEYEYEIQVMDLTEDIHKSQKVSFTVVDASTSKESEVGGLIPGLSDSQSIFLFIALIVVIILVVVIITRGRGEGKVSKAQTKPAIPMAIPETTFLSYEKALKFQDIACPTCSTIFSVPGNLKPMYVKCPNCGLEGIFE